mmetsp:Transcript_15698/g.27544  ORF Transcript_15698/g.27544 Transcript_15698/m.27544 type:complete len:134 (-) Transcript_15698:33-434(-)
MPTGTVCPDCWTSQHLTSLSHDPATRKFLGASAAGEKDRDVMPSLGGSETRMSLFGLVTAALAGDPNTLMALVYKYEERNIYVQDRGVRFHLMNSKIDSGSASFVCSERRVCSTEDYRHETEISSGLSQMIME